MVSFTGKIPLQPHPDWYLLGVHLKFSDKHPRPFYMGVPPGEISFNFGESEFQNFGLEGSGEFSYIGSEKGDSLVVCFLVLIRMHL